MKTDQTNLDRRPYRLTPQGLAALRQSARTHTPWAWSTGPKTKEGKRRSSRNATKHGERTAQRIALRSELAELLRTLREADQQRQPDAVDATTPWLQRIAMELVI